MTFSSQVASAKVTGENPQSLWKTRLCATLLPKNKILIDLMGLAPALRTSAHYHGLAW